ncbi:hypothetical protein H1C71_037627 [Ictidomys tridecemlineatus]|nr:hypothetical protein H1C71_037627 [Ictidomys tridecemlineatus]
MQGQNAPWPERLLGWNCPKDSTAVPLGLLFAGYSHSARAGAEGFRDNATCSSGELREERPRSSGQTQRSPDPASQLTQRLPYPHTPTAIHGAPLPLTGAPHLPPPPVVPWGPPCCSAQKNFHVPAPVDQGPQQVPTAPGLTILVSLLWPPHPCPWLFWP